MKRLRNKLLLAGFALISMNVYAQKDSTKKINHYEFSVQQAVDYATKNNVNVKNALLDVLIQGETNREVTVNGVKFEVESVFGAFG